MIILRKFNLKYKDDYEQMVSSWKRQESFDSMLLNEFNLSYFDLLKQLKELENNQHNPMEFYLAYDKNVLIGYIELRFSMNTFNQNYAGNIGFAVSPLYRNRGYGFEMLKKGIRILKNKKMETIYLTCDCNSITSKHLFEKCGAKYLKNEITNGLEKEIYTI